MRNGFDTWDQNTAGSLETDELRASICELPHFAVGRLTAPYFGRTQVWPRL